MARAVNAALNQDNAASIRQLLSETFVDQHDQHNINMMLVSALKANARTVALLLKNRFHATLENEFACLRSALKNNDVAYMRLLLEFGCHVEEADSLDRTLLHQAAMRGLSEMVAVLYEKQADIEAEDSYGLTPLLSAIAYNPSNRAMILQLLSYGANINFKPQRPVGQRGLLALFATNNQTLPFEEKRSFLHFLLECGLDLDESVCYDCILNNLRPTTQISRIRLMPRNLFEDQSADQLEKRQQTISFLALSLACGVQPCLHGTVRGDEDLYENEEDYNRDFNSEGAVYGAMDEDVDENAAQDDSGDSSLLDSSSIDNDDGKALQANNSSVTDGGSRGGSSGWFCAVAPLICFRSADVELAAYLKAAGCRLNTGFFLPPIDEQYLIVARSRLNREWLLMIKDRATEICVALQSLRLPALVTLLILDECWLTLAKLVPMHLKWKLVTAVKHPRFF